MRKTLISAVTCAVPASARAQIEQTQVAIVPQSDKFGNIINATIVDGYLVAGDGTFLGPVSPDVAQANQMQRRGRTHVDQQIQQQPKVQHQSDR